MPHRLSTGLRDQVVERVRKEYFDCNAYHLTDFLSEEYGIQISRSSTRRIRPEVCLASPKKRRARTTAASDTAAEAARTDGTTTEVDERAPSYFVATAHMFSLNSK